MACPVCPWTHWCLIWTYNICPSWILHTASGYPLSRFWTNSALRNTVSFSLNFFSNRCLILLGSKILGIFIAEILFLHDFVSCYFALCFLHSSQFFTAHCRMLLLYGWIKYICTFGPLLFFPIICIWKNTLYIVEHSAQK